MLIWPIISCFVNCQMPGCAIDSPPPWHVPRGVVAVPRRRMRLIQNHCGYRSAIGTRKSKISWTEGVNVIGTYIQLSNCFKGIKRAFSHCRNTPSSLLHSVAIVYDYKFHNEDHFLVYIYTCKVIIMRLSRVSEIRVLRSSRTARKPSTL